MIVGGLISVSSAFYCGTLIPYQTYSVEISTDWIYISMLVPGVFSFIVGVVGLFGKKYLKAVMYIIILIEIVTIFKLVINYTYQIDLKILFG
mgnify:CR=1 FL=1